MRSDYYQERIEMGRINFGEGICPICGTKFFKSRIIHIYCCEPCREKAEKKRAYDKHGPPPYIPILSLNPEQREKRRARQLLTQRPRYVALKISILTHYGHGKLSCVICGESRIDCLSIDHVNNNGYEERKKNRHYGKKIYKDLRRDGFPLGYQTLCMNCQFIKMQEIRAIKRKSAQVLLALARE